MLTVSIDKTIIKNFVQSSFASIFLRTIHAFFIPIALAQISLSTYGSWYLYNSFMNIVTLLLSLGTRQYLLLKYCDTQQDIKTQINIILSLYFLVSLPVYILLGFNINLINYYVFKNSLSFTLLIICLLTSFLYLLHDIFIQILRMNNQILMLTKIQICSSSLSISAILFLTLKLKLGLIGMAIGNLVAPAVTAIYAFYFFIQNKYCINLSNLKYCLFNSIIFLPTNISTWFLSSSSRWILAYYGTLQDVGIYSLADSLSQIFDLVILQPLQSSYIPATFAEFKTRGRGAQKQDILSIEQKNKKIMFLSMLTLSFIIIFSYIFAKLIFFKFLPNYINNILELALIIMLSQILLMGSQFIIIYLQFLHKDRFLAFIGAMPGVSCIILNLILTPKYKYFGCIFAQLISYILYFIVLLGYNYRQARNCHAHIIDNKLSTQDALTVYNKDESGYV